MLPMVNGEVRLGTEPELRFTPTGVAVCKVRAVASSRKKDQSGEWVDDKTVWLGLVGFKRVAENMAESLKKGDLVVVSGKLNIDDWTDKEGATRTSVEVVIDTIGPSLAFAAAQSVKTEAKARAEKEPATDPADDPWVTTSTTSSDEPPF